MIRLRIRRVEGDAGHLAGLVFAWGGTSAIVVPPPGGATSTQRSPSPNGTSAVSEKPSVLGVERDRRVLVGNRNDHPAYMRDLWHLDSFSEWSNLGR